MPRPTSLKDKIVCYTCLLLNMLWVGSTWRAYDDCAAPVQISVLLILLSMIATSLHFTFVLNRARLTSRRRLFIAVISVFLIFFLYMYITVQAIVWQGKNKQESPDCGGYPSWAIWIYISLMFVLDLLYGVSVAMVTYGFIRKRIEIRRMRHFRRQLSQLQGPELQAFLLSLNAEEDQRTVAMGFSEVQISKIPRIKYQHSLVSFVGNHDECPICLNNFQQGEAVIRMPGCGHMFDPDCATEWLKKSPLCPMCRRNVRKHLHEHVEGYKPPVENMT